MLGSNEREASELLSRTFPQTFRIKNEAERFEIFLIIDSLLSGRSAGGIRMSPDVTEEEVASLARLMTLKFGFSNVYYGGAKAGICLRERISLDERQTILRSFGQEFKGLIGSGIYQPAEDIGTTPEDIATVLKAACDNKNRQVQGSSGVYTAMSIVTTVKVLCEHLGIDLSRATLILEGFGKVGSHVASILCEKGVKFLAVSTRSGAIYNSEGLNLKALLKLKERYSDDCVLHYMEGERISLEQMVTIDTKVLVLAGKPEVINAENCGSIKARIIVPGGNLSVTREAEIKLTRLGYFIFPDFVVNCGGVLGLTWNGMGLSDWHIQRFFDKELSTKLRCLLTFSMQYSVTLREISESIALQNLERMQQEELKSFKKGLLQRIATGLKKNPFRWVFKNILRLLVGNLRGSNGLAYAYAKVIFWADKDIYCHPSKY